MGREDRTSTRSFRLGTSELTSQRGLSTCAESGRYSFGSFTLGQLALDIARDLRLRCCLHARPHCSRCDFARARPDL